MEKEQLEKRIRARRRTICEIELFIRVCEKGLNQEFVDNLVMLKDKDWRDYEQVVKETDRVVTNYLSDFKSDLRFEKELLEKELKLLEEKENA